MIILSYQISSEFAIFNKENERFIDTLRSLLILGYLHGVHLQELQAVQSQGRASTAFFRSIFSATFARVSTSGTTRISDSFMTTSFYACPVVSFALLLGSARNWTVCNHHTPFQIFCQAQYKIRPKSRALWPFVVVL